MLIAAAIAALSTAVLLWIALTVHRSGRPFLPEDPPDTGRKNHGQPVPMSGFLLGLLLTIGIAIYDGWALAVATATATATGFIDDWTKARHIELDWRWKALGLFVATGFALVAADSGHTLWLAALFVFVTVNAFNFLDNQNGVTAGLATATGLLCLVPDHLAEFEASPTATPALLLGVPTAFLFWNWPKARHFLGDGGAYPLGLVAAVLALRQGLGEGPSSQAAWIPTLAVVALPLIDFTQVVLARLYIGQAPWVGDRRHLTHIVLHRGVPKTLLAPLFWALAVGAGLGLGSL